MTPRNHRGAPDPRETVRDGYDKVSFAYRGDSLDERSATFRQYQSWVREMARLIPRRSSVLDLGCGCGVPTAQLLAADHRVTGVDISPVQIERAKRLVPEARFVCGDMCRFTAAPGAFDAVVCLYAIIHVPLDVQPALISRVHRWLRPGGHLLISVGQSAWTGREENWLGIPGGTMVWSHTDRETYLRWFGESGFSVLWERFVPEGDGGHPLLLLRKE